jgi:hypothetical protein
MFNEAVWIDCHSLGGLGGNCVVIELRVASGYGVRWRHHMANDGNETSESNPICGKIYFRGFLEPQWKMATERDGGIRPGSKLIVQFYYEGVLLMMRCFSFIL